MLGRVFKAYDIRGTYPDLLTDAMAWQIGYGCARFLIADAEEAGETTPMMRNILVGRDMRKSSPKLAEELIAGITALGASVIDVGLVDTSFMYFAINHLDCAGGVMVTASHNPPNYNGFKVSKRQAKPVGETSGLADVRKFAAMADRAQIGKGVGGRVEQRDLWAAYAAHVLRFCDLSHLPASKKITAVIDASNGMAGTMIPRVFGPKGANLKNLDIIELNFDNSKAEFAHEPNPLVASNLAQVREAVVAKKADIGFCYDGDADRCVAIDEKGQIIGCDHLTAALAPHMLAASPGAAVVYDLRSTKAVEEQIKAAGGLPVRSRVGHVFMKQAMSDHRAVFGGELSGHFYFRSNFNADSGAIAMSTLLSVMAATGKKPSELIAPVARYAQSGEINFEIEDKDAALADLRETFAPRGSIDDLDGVTIDCFKPEGWWANIRKSNTEPLLRLNCEAKSGAQLTAALSELSPMLGKPVHH